MYSKSHHIVMQYKDSVPERARAGLSALITVRLHGTGYQV